METAKEIQVFPMVLTKTGARLIQHRHQPPDHVDVILTEQNPKSDRPNIILNYRSLTLVSAKIYVEYLEMLFPQAVTTWLAP